MTVIFLNTGVRIAATLEHLHTLRIIFLSHINSRYKTGVSSSTQIRLCSN
jgi:hypothetical protein